MRLSHPETETQFLATFLRHPEAVGPLIFQRNMGVDVFTDHQNQAMFRGLLGIWGRGEPMERYVIARELRKDGILEAAGGLERIQALTREGQTPLVAERMIEDLAEMRTRRAILATTQQVSMEAQSNATPTEELLGSLRALVNKGDQQSAIETPTPLELTKEVLDRAINDAPIATGFRGIDSRCGALYRGDFLVIGGGAKAGKSILATNIAMNIAKNDFVVFFTIEMNRREIWKRAICAQAGIPSSYWDSTLTPDPSWITRATAATASLNSRKVTIIDRVFDIEQAIGIANGLKLRHGSLGAVVFDYVQLFDSGQKTTSRAEAVAHISRAAKRAAVALQTLAIGVSQLNDDGKSLESRGIQRDCNLMVNIEVDDSGKRTVTSAYNRNGAMGIQLPMSAELQYCRFVDVSGF